MKLSILILTVPYRFAQLGRLKSELNAQILPYAGEIEIIVIDGPGSIGEKRNKAMEQANGDYVCFFDDDDFPTPHYIDFLMNATEYDPDCASLKGLITWDGKKAEIFEHSIKYNAYKTNGATDKNFILYNITYERYPNHLNMIKSSIAKQFKFPETNHGEDTDWATQIHKSGLLKNEFYIPQIIYNYRYNSKKPTYV